jgi:Uma2 family endonuclease
MSTGATIEGERRFLLRGLGWEGYQTMLALLADRPVRITYDRGDVELMSPLIAHERFKSLLGRLVEIVTEELDIPLVTAGSTTLNSEELDRGIEPDECFYLASAGRLRDTDRLDLSIDPPPDLAIEVEISSSALGRLGIYAALDIPEVWRFDGETLTVLLLRPDGAYAASDTSRSLPFVPMAEVARLVRECEPNNDTRWARNVRAWVRAVVVPTARDHGGEIAEG